MKIWLVDPSTGAVKHAPASRHWVMQRIALQLALSAALLILNEAIPRLRHGAPELLRELAFLAVILATIVRPFFIARRHGKSLFMRGWRFADPASLDARWALAEWQLQYTPSPTAGAATPTARPAPLANFLHDESVSPSGGLSASPQTSPSPLHTSMGDTMKIMLHNPRTGALKSIKVGFSWTLLLFSSFFGVPLFMRGLYGWAIFFLVKPIVSTFIFYGMHFPTKDADTAATVLSWIIELGLALFIAIKGNKFTALNMLGKGWTFASPDAIETQFAKRKWGLM